MSGQPLWSPDHEVEIVANTPPGGGTDRSARALHEAITANRLLDVAAKVVNAVGRTGTGWCDADAREGDGHVVGISSPSMASDVMIGTLPADTMRFTPIAILYTEYLAFVVDANSPLKTGADLLRMLGGDTAKVSVALATAFGNTNHMALAGVIQHAGGDVGAPAIRVFTSARLAIADVMEGNADVGVITAASAVPEMESDRVRTLAISSPERLHGVFASTPTWRDQDVDCVLGSWRGVGGARGLGDDQIAFWQGVCAAAVATTEWQAALKSHFWTDMYMDGSELAQYLRTEYDETKGILGELGLFAG
jgi:putative tricarboxylic transport membrane protein